MASTTHPYLGRQGILVPSNPYHYSTTYGSMQVTLIGIEFGQKIAGRSESGFGYKGLISWGISLKFQVISMSSW